MQGRVAANPFGHAVAAHSRHHVIHQDDIKRQALVLRAPQHLQTGLAVSGLGDDGAVAL